MDPSIQDYLQRLDASLDAYTNAIRSLAEKLGAHVQNPPPPATSPESTTDASAPVPSVSYSTGKAQEVVEVIHDASPACSAMAHVICSTECSHQVATTDSVDKVTTVYHESVVDLSDKFGALNIPVMASINPPLHVQVPSRKSFADSTRGVAVAGLDEYTLVAATPDVALELAVLSSVSFSTNKCQVGLTAVHDTSAESITVASMTCSRSCSDQVITALSLTSPIAKVPLLPTVTPALVADPDHSAPNAYGTLRAPLAMKDELLKTPCPRMLSVVKAMQPFMNHNLDTSLPQRHQGLPLHPMSWPSLGRDLADDNEVRLIPWPPFPVKKIMEHPFQFVRLLVMGLTSSTFPMESCHVGDLVGNHCGHCIRIISVELLYLWSLQQSSVGSFPSKHAKLFSDNKQWPSKLGTCTIILAVEMHHSGLVPLVVHQLWSVKKHSAWNTASSFGFQLIQCEAVLCSDLANITEQGQLTSLVSTEPSNCCEAGSKRVKFNTLSVFPSCSKHSQWQVACPLSSNGKTSASRPTPWPSFLVHHSAEGNEIRPTP